MFYVRPVTLVTRPLGNFARFVSLYFQRRERGTNELVSETYTGFSMQQVKLVWGVRLQHHKIFLVSASNLVHKRHSTVRVFVFQSLALIDMTLNFVAWSLTPAQNSVELNDRKERVRSFRVVPLRVRGKMLRVVTVVTIGKS